MWQNLRSLALVPPAAPASRSPSPRFAFIDALRLLAALQMIVGHTVDALLRDEDRVGLVFQAWTFVRGLTSTAFFTAAGISFALASAAAPTGDGRLRRLKRACELVLVGFALRAPFGLLWGEPAGPAWARALQSDVLHCMGAALLLSELLFWCVSTRWLRGFFALALGFACFLGAGPLERAVTSLGCGVLSSLVDSRCGAPFPLLPWLGYPLCALGAGVFCTAVSATQPLPRPNVTLRLALASAGFFASAALLRGFVGLPVGRLSPAFCLLKLGLVFGCASLLAGLLGARPLAPLLRRLASETLFLYGSHVVLLYAGHVGLRALVGHRLPVWACLVVALALAAGAALGSLGYRSLLPALRLGKHGGTPRPLRRPSPPG